MSRRSCFIGVRACGNAETNGKMDLYKGMGFELELPDAETVEWSSRSGVVRNC